MVPSAETYPLKHTRIGPQVVPRGRRRPLPRTACQVWAFRVEHEHSRRPGGDVACLAVYHLPSDKYFLSAQLHSAATNPFDAYDLGCAKNA
jgi:hypothetical protein